MTEYNYLKLERAGMFMEDGHSKDQADLLAERALIRSAAAEMAYKKTIFPSEAQTTKQNPDRPRSRPN
jgi:hypothetical protein